MKRIVLILTGSFFVSIGCGSTNNSAITAATTTGECANSPALGTYSGSVVGNTDILNIRADCTLTSTYCVATMTYSNITGTSGNVAITVTSTSGKTGCLPGGTTNCG